MRSVRLGDVCAIVNGGTPKTGVDEYWDGDILWITPKDLGRVKTIKTDHTSRKLTQKGVENSSAKIIPANSVILSTRAPIGHVVINSQPMAFNQGCRGLVPGDDITTKYLYYFLKLSKNHLNDLGTGTTFRELSTGALSGVNIPLPSPQEQQRIVARLDAAFEKISRAEVLMRQNLDNVTALQKSILHKYLSASDSTHTHRLGDVITLQRGYDLPKRLRKSGTYLLASSSGIIDTHNEFKASGPGVFVGRSGSVGNTFYIEEDFWPLNTTLYVKDFHGNNPRYCYWLLKNIDLTRFAGGTGVPTLNRNIVHEYKVEVAEKEEQGSIAKKIDEALNKAQELEAQYRKKLSKLTDLRQSLLTEAFAN